VPSSSSGTRAPGRLGVYIDDVYWKTGPEARPRLSSDRSFVLFLCEVGSRFDGFVLFGRTVSGDRDADYLLPPGVGLVELPHYSKLLDVPQVVGAVAGSMTRFWRALDAVDVLWIFGPHPFSVAFATLAATRGKRVVLGVRQDSPRLYRERLPGRRWVPVVLTVDALDRAYRLLGRRFPVTVQGVELARRYGRKGARVLPMTESIVRAGDVVEHPQEHDWTGTVDLLTVGRFDPEKNPLLLVDALAELERRAPGRYRLTWVGRGPLEAQTRARAAELGVSDRIEFIGYLGFDAGLLDLYRNSHAFVHVSLSEGVPKVLLEALACGTPIVATDVGGVSALLDGGQAGLIVPPSDGPALVDAIEAIVRDEGLRDRLVDRGLSVVRDRTLEAEAERVVRFFRDESGRNA
jgi:glycosyltransferase involved in cell wall biosynthesis